MKRRSIDQREQNRNIPKKANEDGDVGATTSRRLSRRRVLKKSPLPRVISPTVGKQARPDRTCDGYLIILKREYEALSAMPRRIGKSTNHKSLKTPRHTFLYSIDNSTRLTNVV